MVKELRSKISDIPAEANPSSIGPLAWPPIPDNENRRRGVFRQIIQSPRLLNRVRKQFSELSFSDEISRNSARIFVTDQVLNELTPRDKNMIDPFIEAIIPLKGSGVYELNDVNLIYLGNNSPTRLLSVNDMRQEMDMAENIFRSTDPSRYYSHEGVNFNVISPDLRRDAEIQRQFSDLYSAFGWTEQDVIKILNSQNNLLVGAFDNDGLLISTGMAEKVVVPLMRNNKQLHLIMYEITEAATREEYRGKGLYLAVAFILNRLLTETDANLVYGESNLASAAIVKAAHRQGRHSALANFESYGLSKKPLRQTVRISGGTTDDRPRHLKNDLLVTYLVRDELIKIHGKPNS